MVLSQRAWCTGNSNRESATLRRATIETNGFSTFHRFESNRLRPDSWSSTLDALDFTLDTVRHFSKHRTVAMSPLKKAQCITVPMPSAHL